MTTPGPLAVRRTLWGVAAVAALVGLVLRVLLPAVDVAPQPPVVPAAESVAVSPMPALDVAAAEEIVLANMFSVTRRPPATRYVPPEFVTDSAEGAMASGSPAMPMMGDSLAGMTADGPRLLGTVVVDGNPRALLQLSPASGPRLYAVGDRDGGFTVVSVAPREVVLRGPSGRRTLRLSPEDRP